VTEVTISYALPFPTHYQYYTLLACVMEAFAIAENTITLYILRVWYFFRRVRPIVIRRYRDIAAVCVLKTHVRVFFPALMQCHIKRFRHFYGGRVVSSHACDMFCTRSPTNNWRICVMVHVCVVVLYAYNFFHTFMFVVDPHKRHTLDVWMVFAGVCAMIHVLW
jgi:hypothetical protein